METLTLPSGRVVRLELPDLYQLAGADIKIPNTALDDVLELTMGGNPLPEMDEATAMRAINRRFTRAVYAAAALCLVDPVLCLNGKPKPGQITPREFALNDAVRVYTFFRDGGTGAPPVATSAEPGADAGISSSGDDVPRQAQ